MGFKSWLRKKLIDEVTEKQPQPQTQLPNVQGVQTVFQIDQHRHNAVMAILQGMPFFCVYQSGPEIKTISTIDNRALKAGIETMAKQQPQFAEELLNIVIDVNTAKTATERKTD